MPGVDGDYLDALLGEEKLLQANTEAQKDESPPTPKGDGPERLQSTGEEAIAVPLPGVGPRRKKRFTVQIDPAIPEELRNAAVWFMMSGERASVAGLVEQALRTELDRIRSEHFDGGPIPQRPYDPPPGRRL